MVLSPTFDYLKFRHNWCMRIEIRKSGIGGKHAFLRRVRKFLFLCVLLWIYVFYFSNVCICLKLLSVFSLKPISWAEQVEAGDDGNYAICQIYYKFNPPPSTHTHVLIIKQVINDLMIANIYTTEEIWWMKCKFFYCQSRCPIILELNNHNPHKFIFVQ